MPPTPFDATPFLPPRARYIAVAGTHGAATPGRWNHPESAFACLLRGLGYAPLREREEECYGWSAALDGVDDQHLDWQFAGRNLFHYIVPPLADHGPAIPSAQTNILCFSHGLQVVMYACGRYGLKVNGLISVGSPIRGDLDDLYAIAASNIRTHVHLHAGKRDVWQVLGGLFDGRWGVHRAFPYGARNIRTPGAHGSLLTDQTLWPLWQTQPWLADAFTAPQEESGG